MMDLITDISNKVAQCAGFEASQYNKSTRLTEELVHKSLNGAVPISDYIFYRYYDKENQLFFDEHGLGGFSLEISSLVGSNAEKERSLEAFFKKELPEGYFMQFLLVASNEVDSMLSLWESGRINPHPVLQKLTKSRSNFIRKRAGDMTPKKHRIARDFRLFVNVSKKVKDKPKATKELLAFKADLLEKFDSLDIMSRVCDDHDLIALVKEIFEYEEGKQKQYKCNAPYDDLDFRVMSSGMRYRLDDERLNNLTTNISTSCFALDEYPADWTLGKMINLLGLGNDAKRDLPCRFIISYTVANTVSNTQREAALAKGQKVIDASEQWYSRSRKDLQKQAANWREVIHAVKNEEDKFLTENFQVLVSSSSKNLSAAERAITDLYEKYGFILTRQDGFHLPCILSCLPMMQSTHWWPQKVVKNVKKALASTILGRLPLQAEWKGMAKSGVLFEGRMGQVFSWNPFDKSMESNSNVAVIGTSGAGKSVSLNVLAESMISQNVRVFVLDIGQSFKDTSSLFDGEVIQFGKVVEFVLNPFAGFNESMDLDDFNELVKSAKELLVVMCRDVCEEGEAALEEAVMNAVQEHNYQLDINQFVKYLKNSSNEYLQKYGRILYSFTEKGVYGKYFSGKKSATFKKPMTVFEFEEIKGDEKLLPLVLNVILMEITNQFLTGDRSQNFMIIVDEAWHILNHEASFLANFARTVRKYGGSLVTCVQGFKDLQNGGKTDANNTDRQTIFNNSAWSLILKQKGGLDAFAKSEVFEDKVDAIKSIRFEKGKYSEIMIAGSDVAVIGRLILDNYSKTLYSTDADDYSKLISMKNQGISLDRAIEILAEQKYGEEAC